MQRPSPGRGQRSVDRRRQQGMREPQPIAVRHQDARLLSLEQRSVHVEVRPEGSSRRSRRSGVRARPRPMPRPAPARESRSTRSLRRSCRVRGTGRRSPSAGTAGPRARAPEISSAKNGLPPDASATRTSIGRESLRRSRDSDEVVQGGERQRPEHKVFEALPARVHARGRVRSSGLCVRRDSRRRLPPAAAAAGLRTRARAWRLGPSIARRRSR